MSFEFEKPSETGTNRSMKVTGCRTCHGDRFVTVSLRLGGAPTPEGHQPSFYEEVSGCPDCNPIHDLEGYFPGGRKFRVMDPAAVRQAMTQ